MISCSAAASAARAAIGHAARRRAAAGAAPASLAARWDAPASDPSPTDGFDARQRRWFAQPKAPPKPRKKRNAPRKGPKPVAPFGFAAVDHGPSYDAELSGRHGTQLRLALDEGVGKDDPPFDPFANPATAKGYVDFDELVHEDADDEYDEEGIVAAEAAEEESALGDEPLSDEEEVEDYVDNLEEESDDEDFSGDAEYGADGFPLRPKSQLASLRAGMPAGGLFAVIDLNGSQQKVAVDDVIAVNKLRPVEKWAVGETLTLKGEDGSVLLVGSTHLTLVGIPAVKGAEVDVMVEEITRDAKVIVFKKRRRKNSRRKRGFRREVTMLRVLDVRFPGQYADREYKPRV